VGEEEVLTLQMYPLVFVLLCLAVRPVPAAPLTPDRPGEAETTSIVTPGAIQLEGGFGFARETKGDDPKTNTVTVPQLLMRVGLLPTVEARLGADGFILEDRAGAQNRTGGSDLELGTKIRLFDQLRLRPTAALLLAVSFPTGGSAATSDGVDPRGRLLLNWELGQRFSLDANLDLAGPTQGVDDSRRVFEVQPVLSLGMSMTKRLSAFVETFSAFKDQSEQDEYSIDGGIAYLVHDDLQLDISAGAGLNDPAPDFFVSFGLAWRYWSP